MIVKTYTDLQRREAVKVYLETADYTETFNRTNVEEAALKYWQKTDPEWWLQTVISVCEDMKEEVRPGWARILMATVEKIQDRLESGDQRMTKDGDIVNVPVPAKELAKIAELASEELRKYPGVGMSPIDAERRSAELKERAAQARAERDGQALH